MANQADLQDTAEKIGNAKEDGEGQKLTVQPVAQGGQQTEGNFSRL